MSKFSACLLFAALFSSVACAKSAEISLADDSIQPPATTVSTPSCNPPTTLEYWVDADATDEELDVIVSGVEVWNDFSLEAITREVLSYQGRRPSWQPGVDIKPVTLYLLRPENTIGQMWEAFPGCKGTVSTGGCGIYRSQAFVFATRLKNAVNFVTDDYRAILGYVSAHEMGHVLLGGGHLPTEGSLMGPVAQSVQPTLTAPDKAWFCTKYCCTKQYPMQPGEEPK
ncbi:MAG: hypothetical protein PHT12_05495 [Patescibacteria group bacterium]|nr:hypothetical protein [Patescibacteria group bacterium]